MDSKPLSYDSLKIVLQYMEANKRFQISQRIPSTRTADRVTPLFVHQLEFDGFNLFINNSCYTLKTFIDNWNVPYANFFTFYGADGRGRFGFDLDQFGLEDVSPEAIVTPGDLINEKRRGRGNNFERREMAMRHLEEQLEGARNDLNKRNDYAEYYQRRIENFQAQLIPYHCSRNNTPLPYKINQYIEFHQSSPNGQFKWEQLAYTKKLPEAMKYLTTKFFGNRKHPIIVRRLENFWNRRTIRLPADVKMQVRELKVEKMSDAKQLLPIIQNPTLEVFELEYAREDDFGMEILKTARSLTIGCSNLENWLPHVRNLQNRQVLLMGIDVHDRYFERYFERYFGLLMKRWICKGKDIGTCFSFGLDKNAADIIKRMVMERFGRLTIAMRNQCKLVISFEDKTSEKTSVYNVDTWRMKMEVVE